MPIYPLDSPTSPSVGFSSSNIVAAHGVLAEAYESSQAPGQTCPCLIFETSTDHGATFTRHIVPTVNGSSSPEPFLAADPKVDGRFALTILDSTGTENQIYVTDDSGAHLAWTNARRRESPEPSLQALDHIWHVGQPRTRLEDAVRQRRV